MMSVFCDFQIYKDPNGFDCLNIASASRGVAGEYEIKATNDMGTAGSKCNLKVNSKYSSALRVPVPREHLDPPCDTHQFSPVLQSQALLRRSGRC